MFTHSTGLDIATADIAPSPPLRDLRAELERHHADCAGWALSCCAWDRTEADDVLQTTYLKVLDGRAVYGGRATFRTWLFGVIRLTAAEQRRRKAVRRVLAGRFLEAIRGTEPSVGVPYAGDDESAGLVNALAELPRRQREVLHLVFYQDCSIEQAASVLQISLGSARTHYERGKARLRERLGVGASRASEPTMRATVRPAARR